MTQPSLYQNWLEITESRFSCHVIKKSVWGFPPGMTQISLYNHRRWLEAKNVGKTKVLISCTVTLQLICIFAFANAKNMISHDAAHTLVCPHSTEIFECQFLGTSVWPSFFYFLFYRFLSQQVRVGGQYKNKIHSDHFPITCKSKSKET